MQNKQSLQKLVDYFRNFTFDSFHIRVQRGTICKFCQSEKTNHPDDKESVEQLYNSVMNGRKMASQFQEKMHELLMQNQRLEQQVASLREEMRDQKQYCEKTLQQSSNIIQALRTQLIDKQDLRRQLLQKEQQNRTLIEQLSHIENQLDLTQHQLRNYQMQAAADKELECKKRANPTELEHYQEQIRTINQNLQLSHLSNSSLINTINQLQSQIRILTQNTTPTQNPILSQQQLTQVQQQHQHHRFQHQIHLYHNYSKQLIDLSQTSLQYDHLQHIDLQPQENQQTSSSVLKDILNSLTQHREQTLIDQKEKSTKQTIFKPHPSEKQNMHTDANCHPIQTKQKPSVVNSISKSSAKQKAKINQQISLPPPRKQFQLLTQFSIRVDEPQHQNLKNNQIQNKQTKSDYYSDMNKLKFEKHNEEKYSDPYYLFFMLTGQCIKINSQQLEEIAAVDVGEIWEEVIEKRVPMNEWNHYLQSAIYRRAGIVFNHN